MSTTSAFRLTTRRRLVRAGSTLAAIVLLGACGSGALPSSAAEQPVPAGIDGLPGDAFLDDADDHDVQSTTTSPTAAASVTPSDVLVGDPGGTRPGAERPRPRGVPRTENRAGQAEAVPSCWEGWRIQAVGATRSASALGWFHPAEGLSRTVVELVGDGVEVGLGVDGEVGAFGHPLAEEAVGVLVGAALPGRVGVAEVDVDAGVDAERGVLGHLPALVPGDRSDQVRRAGS